MDMKNLIQQMTNIENSSKEKLNEAANLSVSAETGAEIADMIRAMQGHAGMGDKPVGDVVHPMRHDIERFRAAVNDDPAIPGRDDVEGDQDLQAGALGSAIGGGLGSMVGGPAGAAVGSALGSNNEPGAGMAALGGVAGNAIAGPVGGAVGAGLGQMLGSDDGDDPNIPGRDDVEGDQDLQAGMLGSIAGGLGGAALGSALGGPIGGIAGKALGGVGGKVAGAMGSKIGSAIGKAAPSIAGSMVGSEIGDKLTGDDNEMEGYDNEPNPEYQDHKHMTKDLSGGINREKKAYAKAQDGDNAMAVEAIKAQLMAALQEKKAKPDFLDMDKDGNTKEPMKKAIKDKKAKK
jgi:hypothetical protein